jgi:hypothetical protein
MAKVTDTQLIVLSKAASREDGAAVDPPKMNKAAAMKVVWREDEDGGSMSLVITRAGRDAIGINEPDEMYQPVVPHRVPDQAGPCRRDAVEAAGHDARRLGESNQPYDSGGLDGSSQARLCGGADPERDQGLALPDCEWSKRRGRSLIYGGVNRSLAVKSHPILTPSNTRRMSLIIRLN